MRNEICDDGIIPTEENAGPLDGLALSGTVVDRTRRMVPKEAPTTLIVTYTIEDEMGNKYYVDDYAPKSFFERGMYVSVPVYIKAYTKRNKEPAYTINIKKQLIYEKGEHF